MDTPREKARSRLLDAMLQSSLDCVVVLDHAGRVVEFNPASERLFGYARADVLGQPVAPLVIPERYHAEFEEGIRPLASTGKSRYLGQRVETHALCKDGREVPVELAMTEVKAGGERYVVASMRDLTAEERSKAALRETEARLAAFMTNAPVGMYLKDREGRYVMANREMAKVFGRPHTDAIGKTAKELFSADDARMIAENDARIRETGEPESVEEHLPERDEYAWTLVVRFPVDRADGTVEIGGFDIDISRIKTSEQELRRSREALHQAEKLAALGSLLAGVSHELNNPLSAVIGQSLMLKEDLEGRPEADRARKIRSAAERCGRIVQTFLAMARQRTPERTAVDLNTVIKNALSLAEYGLRTASVEVETDLCADLPSIHADGDQLHQAIVNLVINAQQALEAQDGPRRVRISTAREGDTLTTEIVDNGPGIPAEIKGRIFDPFFTTKEAGSGTGVGLSFAQGIVESHGGRLELRRSKTGAHFRITLPMGEHPVEPAPAATGKPATPQQVLVLDDEAEVAETLAELLQRDGYSVTVALTVQEARGHLETGAFSVLFSDLRMPGEDGIAFHRWLTATHGELARRTIFITGDVLGSNVAKFLKSNPQPVVEKPFTTEALRGAIKALQG